MAFGSAEALLHLALTGNLIPQITNLGFTITFPALNIFRTSVDVILRLRPLARASPKVFTYMFTDQTKHQEHKKHREDNTSLIYGANLLDLAEYVPLQSANIM